MAKAKTAESSVKKPAKAKKPMARPTLEQVQEDIKAKAHQVYLQRISAGEPGDELSDWLRAEADVRSKYGL
jgi:hypothetical protein